MDVGSNNWRRRQAGLEKHQSKVNGAGDSSSPAGIQACETPGGDTSTKPPTPPAKGRVYDWGPSDSNRNTDFGRKTG